MRLTKSTAPKRSRSRTTGAKSGFTLLELTISVTVLAILARVLVGASEATSHLADAGGVQARMHEQAERAMRAVLEDLRRSGYQTIGGRTYPHVFDAGAPDAAFSEFAFTPAPSAAAAGEPDFGPLRTIVFCVPSDLDGDGRPEIDADADGVPELDGNGDGVPTDDPADTGGLWNPSIAAVHPTTRLVWDTGAVGYQLVAGADGRSELVRFSGTTGARDVVARGVDRVQFDTPASSGFQIPLGSVRVRVFLRATSAVGHVYRSRSEAIVRLRNS
ncbi:MAG: prepilin-type N-terminal cleavage/methylation domain-containing protein [Planctomycetota bacterium]